jgi:hypothetical protein
MGGQIAPTGCHCPSAEPAGAHIAPTGGHRAPTGSQIAPTRCHCPSAEPARAHIAPTGGHRAPTGDQIAPTGAHIAPTGGHIAPTGRRKSRFRRANSTLRTNAIMPFSRTMNTVKTMIHSDPTRSDPIRSDTGAYTSFSGIDPTRSDPIPELTHPLPEWTRSYPTRYRSLYIIFRCGADPIRSDTGVCELASGMDPPLSDPIPKLRHSLPEWIRSYPFRYPSLSLLFRNGSDPVRSDTGAYTPSSGMDPVLSDPIPELIHYLQV